MGNALKFRHIAAPKHPSEKARLKVIKGPDMGSVFVITGTRVSIGRGDENDIVLSDLKASRLHAELDYRKEAWKAKDLGSANGILWNGQNKVQADLKSFDTLSLGETTFEFFTPDLDVSILESPAREMALIQSQQSHFEVRQKQVRELGGALQENSKFSLKKAGIVLGVGMIGIVFILFDNEPKRTPNIKNKDTVEGRDLATYLPTVSGSFQDKTAEILFRSGFREYRERNYLRAKAQFETVLQIAPAHYLSRFYLENCDKEIENEVKLHLVRGKKNQDTGKFREAKSNFEAVMRLLYRDQNHAAYLDAKEQLEKMAKEQQKRTEGDS